MPDADDDLEPTKGAPVDIDERGLGLGLGVDKPNEEIDHEVADAFVAAAEAPFIEVAASVRQWWRWWDRPVPLSLLAGLLVAGSLPPWGFWPLAFGGLLLLDRVLAGASAKSRLWRGFLVGLALFAPTVLWISQLTAPGYVVAVLLFAFIQGLFCLAVPPSAGRRPALIGAWVLCESLRMAWPFGGVPLSLLAVGQVAGPLAGIARVGGVLGIAIATVTLAVALSAALQRQAKVAGAAAIAAVALLLVAATVAPKGHETGKRLDIAFVQGGGPQGTHAIDTDMRKVFERHLDASAKVPQGMDLVLWPEDVVDTEGPVQQAREGRDLQALARRLHAPVVVGTVETKGATHFVNSSQVLTADGEWKARYVKVQRVPFGEWVPFRSLIEKVAPDTLATRDATISHESGLLPTPAGKLAVVISWEVFFGRRARSGVKAGGQLLYNPTNGSTYTGTFVQTQQVASSRLRAIETGRWEVQVAPTGFSAFVSPEGRVHQRTGTREQSTQVRRGVPLREGLTWYVRWGDLPARVAAILLVAAGWALDRRRRPAGQPPELAGTAA
jgi:apolipoprotein N-acyltransferase